jgi:hypothetical protein
MSGLPFAVSPEACDPGSGEGLACHDEGPREAVED